jgi:AP-2 complex subunit alpha
MSAQLGIYITMYHAHGSKSNSSAYCNTTHLQVSTIDMTNGLLIDFIIEDSHVRELIRESLQNILNLALTAPTNVQQNNAQNAILFEAINLIIHLDTEQALMKQISTRLGRFIQSRETNVRYLGLEAMTHLAARAETLDPIKQHQEIIIASLRDRDISVRRKGLDLLYSMCDLSNAHTIVSELLKYLQIADYAIREEMVLKVAILTEKYATDVQWYVDISLQLIAMAGDHVSDEVWQRVIQIVTNNEELQVYAAQNSLQYVKADHCHETLVKIGAYVLGEFGHLIAEDRGCSPIEQFLAIQGKLQGCSSTTRAMILSCFVKFVNLFPEIKPQLSHVFEVYSHTIDSELQQRACEYLALVNLPNDDLLRTVCDEMPLFPERQSVLLSRLHQKHIGNGDKRTWAVGGKSANLNHKDFLKGSDTGLKRDFGSQKSPVSPSLESDANDVTTNSAAELAGLNINSVVSPNSKPSQPVNLTTTNRLTTGWQKGYNQLLTKADGVLFEDGQIVVRLRSEYRAQMACIILYFSNKTPGNLESFTTTILVDSNEKAKIGYDIKKIPDSSIAAGGHTQQIIMFEAKTVFSTYPTIRISYLAGIFQAITLAIPLCIHKYMDKAELSPDDFFKRWKQIGGEPREAQRIFGLERGSNLNHDFIRETVEGYGWGILEGVESSKKNFVGATVLHTSEGGKFGCLMRLEPNYETQVSFWQSY